jgi:hypothetical protein
MGTLFPRRRRHNSLSCIRPGDLERRTSLDTSAVVDPHDDGLTWAPYGR